MIEWISEFTLFLKVNKKLWLLPLILVLLATGGLVVIAQSSAIAPLIYTLF